MQLTFNYMVAARVSARPGLTVGLVTSAGVGGKNIIIISIIIIMWRVIIWALYQWRQ